MPEIIRLGLTDPASIIVCLCWLIFVVVWLVSSRFVKPTAERTSSKLRLVTIVIPFCAALLLLWRTPPGGLGTLVVRHTATDLWLAATLTVAGLAVALWARFTLAGNWSGGVTFKAGHELVVRGPYRYVRHPIYTGILVLLLGTAIANGRVSGFVALAMMAAGFWFKLGQEEALLCRHFPDSYPPYRARVKALIPYLL